jgi:hypothetical protein
MKKMKRFYYKKKIKNKKNKKHSSLKIQFVQIQKAGFPAIEKKRTVSLETFFKNLKLKKK